MRRIDRACFLLQSLRVQVKQKYPLAITTLILGILFTRFGSAQNVSSSYRSDSI
jgi:hypothetical protein